MVRPLPMMARAVTVRITTRCEAVACPGILAQRPVPSGTCGCMVMTLGSAFRGIDSAILHFLGSLPEERQPNLLFAAARYLLGVPADITRLRALVSQNRAGLTGVMLARRTQTNEPAPCATPLPALAQLPPPLALIEAGASAGLTPPFDRYSYDYAGHRIAGQDPWRLPCAASRAGRCPFRPGARSGPASRDHLAGRA